MVLILYSYPSRQPWSHTPGPTLLAPEVALGGSLLSRENDSFFRRQARNLLSWAPGIRIANLDTSLTLAETVLPIT